MFAPKVHGELQWFERRTPGVRAWLHPRVGPELSSRWLQGVPAIATPSANASRDRSSGWSADGAWFLKVRKGHARKLLQALARGLELEDCGLPIPVHLGVLVSQGQTTLITEALEAGTTSDLDRVLPQLRGSERAALCAQLGELVAQLHTAGFRQRDLKAPNLLVTQDGALVLVDLEGVSRAQAPRHFLKDLGRLGASFLAMLPEVQARADLSLVLDAYREQGPGGLPSNLFDAVLNRAQRKVARNLRLGRPLR